MATIDALDAAEVSAMVGRYFHRGRSGDRRQFLVALFAIAATLLGAFPGLAAGKTTDPAVAPSDSDANGSRSQAVEKLALRILDTTPVKEAIAQGLKTYEASPVAAKPDALRDAKSAAIQAGMS